MKKNNFPMNYIIFLYVMILYCVAGITIGMLSGQEPLVYLIKYIATLLLVFGLWKLNKVAYKITFYLLIIASFINLINTLMTETKIGYIDFILSFVFLIWLRSNKKLMNN